ncbi:MAG: hypothetical protein JNM39_01815 [Bdellovibrionaceae bacterium]|nr:hypothetical protein [Pseudobdellovibrionaceae bacterium]
MITSLAQRYVKQRTGVNTSVKKHNSPSPSTESNSAAEVKGTQNISGKPIPSSDSFCLDAQDERPAAGFRV